MRRIPSGSENVVILLGDADSDPALINLKVLLEYDCMRVAANLKVDGT